MAMVDGPSPFVVFRDSLSPPAEDTASDEPEGVQVGRVTSEYFRMRERAERAAAKDAKCVAARRVHQKLAQFYAALVAGP
jgi:hypothetical protein